MPIFTKDNEDIKISFKNHKTFNIKIYDLLHSWTFVKLSFRNQFKIACPFYRTNIGQNVL